MGIVGLGGLGLVGARIAVLKGATVIAADPREKTWEHARAAGVERIVKDVSEYEGLGLDVVVDFAGYGSRRTARSRPSTQVELLSKSVSVWPSSPSGPGIG